jgi:hypothetical protein
LYSWIQIFHNNANSKKYPCFIIRFRIVWSIEKHLLQDNLFLSKKLHFYVRYVFFSSRCSSFWPSFAFFCRLALKMSECKPLHTTYFVKEFLLTNPNFYTTLIIEINRQATKAKPFITTSLCPGQQKWNSIFNNWVNINTCKSWINLIIRLNLNSVISFFKI